MSEILPSSGSNPFDLQTIDEEATSVVSPLDFDTWDSQIGKGIPDREQKWRSYANYHRMHWFDQGALTPQVETNIKSSLKRHLLEEGFVTAETPDAEIFKTEPISLEKQTNLIARAYGENVAGAWKEQKESGGSEEVLNKTLNDAKAFLVDTGDLPFASLQSLDGERQIIGGTSILDSVSAFESSVRDGAITYDDAILVQSGLQKGSDEGLSRFSDQRKGRLLSEIEALIADKGGNEIAREHFDGLSNLLLREDRGESAKEELHGGMFVKRDKDFYIKTIRQQLAEEYAKDKDVDLSVASKRFSDKEIKSVIEEQAAMRTNLTGEFEYFSDAEDTLKNIRIFGDTAVAHPQLMLQPERFSEAVASDERLTEDQKASLRNQREFYRRQRFESVNKMLKETKATSERWIEMSAKGIQAGEDPVDTLDRFLSNSENYDAFKNQSTSVLASIGDSFSSLYNIPAALLFKSEAAAKRLGEAAQDEARRREVAKLFNQDYGLGMDIATLVAPVLVDIGATAVLSATTMGAGGAAYIGLKTGTTLTAKGFAQGMLGGVMRTASRKEFVDAGLGYARKLDPKQVAARELAEKNLKEKLIRSTSEKNAIEAINIYNQMLDNKLLMSSKTFGSLFVTSANRSAGGMFTTIYGSMPDDMSHDEKYDAAIGSALLAGTITGLITTGFMKLGRGGLEEALLDGMTWRQMKGVMSRQSRVKLGDEESTRIAREFLEQNMKRSLGDSPIIEGTLSEAIEEGLDEIAQTFVRDAALNEDTPLREIAANVGHSMLLGGIMGGGATGARKLYEAVAGPTGDESRYRAQVAEDIITKLKEAGAPATADELAEQETRRLLTADVRDIEESQEEAKEAEENEEEEEALETPELIYDPSNIMPRDASQIQFVFPEDTDETEEQTDADLKTQNFLDKLDENISPESVEESLAEQLDARTNAANQSVTGVGNRAAKDKAKVKNIYPEDRKLEQLIARLNEVTNLVRGEDYLFATAEIPVSKEEFIDDHLTGAEIKAFEELIRKGVPVDLTKDRVLHGMPDRTMYPKGYYENKSKLLQEYIDLRYPKRSSFLPEDVKNPVKDNGKVIGYLDEDGNASFDNDPVKAAKLLLMGYSIKAPITTEGVNPAFIYKEGSSFIDGVLIDGGFSGSKKVTKNTINEVFPTIENNLASNGELLNVFLNNERPVVVGTRRLGEGSALRASFRKQGSKQSREQPLSEVRQQITNFFKDMKENPEGKLEVLGLLSPEADKSVLESDFAEQALLSLEQEANLLAVFHELNTALRNTEGAVTINKSTGVATPTKKALEVFKQRIPNSLDQAASEISSAIPSSKKKSDDIILEFLSDYVLNDPLLQKDTISFRELGTRVYNKFNAFQTNYLESEGKFYPKDTQTRRYVRLVDPSVAATFDPSAVNFINDLVSDAAEVLESDSELRDAVNNYLDITTALENRDGQPDWRTGVMSGDEVLGLILDQGSSLRSIDLDSKTTLNREKKVGRAFLDLYKKSIRGKNRRPVHTLFRILTGMTDSVSKEGNISKDIALLEDVRARIEAELGYSFSTPKTVAVIEAIRKVSTERLSGTYHSFGEQTTPNVPTATESASEISSQSLDEIRRLQNIAKRVGSVEQGSEQVWSPRSKQDPNILNTELTSSEGDQGVEIDNRDKGLTLEEEGILKKIVNGLASLVRRNGLTFRRVYDKGGLARANTTRKEVSVNANAVAKLIKDGKSESVIKRIMTAIVGEEVAHVAAYKSIPISQRTRLIEQTSDAEFEAIVDEYTPLDSQKETNEQLKAALKSEDPAVVQETKERLMEEKLRMYAQERIRGVTSEANYEFWTSDPTKIQIVLEYFRRMVTRLLKAKRSESNNPELDMAISNLVEEINLLLGKERFSSGIFAFDPNAPDNYLSEIQSTTLGEVFEDSALSEDDMEEEARADLTQVNIGPFEVDVLNSNLENVGGRVLNTGLYVFKSDVLTELGKQEQENFNYGNNNFVPLAEEDINITLLSQESIDERAQQGKQDLVNVNTDEGVNAVLPNLSFHPPEISTQRMSDGSIKQSLVRRVVEQEVLNNFVEKYIIGEPSPDTGRIYHITLGNLTGNPQDSVEYPSPSNSVVVGSKEHLELREDAVLNSHLGATDREYLKLAENPERNKKQLQDMVDQAARKAGFIIEPRYHAGPEQVDIFQADKTLMGMGAFFFADNEKAAIRYHNYSEEMKADELEEIGGEYEKKEPKVVKAYLKMNNPEVYPDFWETFTSERFKPNDQADFFKGLQSKGRDSIVIGKDKWVRGEDDITGEQYVVLNKPENIKSAEAVTYDAKGNVIPLSQRFDTTKESILYTELGALDKDYMELIQNPKENRFKINDLVEKAAEAAGFPTDYVMYHGTTHEFDVFTKERGQRDNNFGVGFYFSTSEDDSETNYLSKGGDITRRVKDRGEQIESGDMEDIETYEELEKFAREKLSSDQFAELTKDWESKGKNDGDMVFLENKESTAEAIARRELIGPTARVIRAYVKLDNPAIIGLGGRGDDQSVIEALPFYDEEAIANESDNIRQELAKEQGISPDEVTDDDLRDALTEWAEENEMYNQEVGSFGDAVQTVMSNYNMNPEGDEFTALMERLNYLSEDVTYDEVEDALREAFQYVENVETSQIETGEAARQVFEEMGHDGIVDNRVVAKFNMDGVYDGDFHVIAFDNKSIKSAEPISLDNEGNVIPLSARFDTSKESYLYSELGASDKIISGYTYDAEGISVDKLTKMLEAPIYEDGVYDSEKRQNSWWRKLKVALTGALDIRVRRLFENREAFNRAIQNDVNLRTAQLKKALDKDFIEKGFNVPYELISQATGSTKIVSIPDDVKDSIKNRYKKAQNNIRKSAKRGEITEEEKTKKLEEARNKYKNEIRQQRQVQTEIIRKKKDAALTKLNQMSPDLVAGLKDLRDLVDELSIKLKDLYGVDVDLGMKIDDNLGIYLTRSYKMFNDAGWMDKVLKDDSFGKVRDNAVAYFEDMYMQSRINALVKEGKGENEAKTLAKKEISEDEGELGKSMMYAFLHGYKDRETNTLTDTGKASKSFAAPLVDQLRKKKDIDKSIRALLGEDTDEGTGFKNILRTYLNVGLMASNQAFMKNLLDMGRRKGNEWILTKDELNKKRLENVDEYGGDRYVQIRAGGSEAYDPFRNFEVDVDGTKQTVKLFAPAEMVQGLQAALGTQDSASLGTAEDIAKASFKFMSKLSGLALGSKTLGSIGFYVRNVVSNAFYFGPAQGFVKFGNMGQSLVDELKRRGITQETISDYHTELIALDVIGNEVRPKLIEELLGGQTSPKKMMDDFDKNLSRLTDEETKIGRAKELAVQANEKTWGKAKELSAIVDAFYKIALFEHELKHLIDARAAARKKNDSGDRYAGLSDYQLKRLAAEKVVRTSQTFSQAPPIITGLQGSSFGVMFAPFLRFKGEVIRTYFNTWELGMQEVNDSNPVIRMRGAKRLAGIGSITAIAGIVMPITARALMGISYDDEEALRDSMPPYLRHQTFMYYTSPFTKERKNFSMTFINPYSLLADPALRAMEHLVHGDTTKTAESVVKGFFGEFLDDQIFMRAFLNVKGNYDPDTEKPIYETNDPLGTKVAEMVGYVFNEAYNPPTLEKLWEEKAITAHGVDPERVPDLIANLATQFLPAKSYPIDLEVRLSQFLRLRKNEYDRYNSRKNKMFTDDAMTNAEVKALAKNEIENRRRVNQHISEVFRAFERMGMSKEEMYNIALTRGMGKRRAMLLIGKGIMDRPALTMPYIERMAKKGETHIQRLKDFQSELNKAERYQAVDP